MSSDTTASPSQAIADTAGRAYEATGSTDTPATRMDREELMKLVDEVNREVAAAYVRLPFNHPIGQVRWVPIEKVHPNDYNPNSVAGQEMKLLHTSISEDGYTQPIVALYDEDNDQYQIVDGFHRYTTMLKYADTRATTNGFLPLVVIDKPIADRIASTVRHNRARGKHSIGGMSNLVFQMLEEGETDGNICEKLGLEAEELARLKHITGFSKLFKDMDYSTSQLSKNQMMAKAEYRRTHPDEDIPAV